MHVSQQQLENETNLEESTEDVTINVDGTTQNKNEKNEKNEKKEKNDKNDISENRLESRSSSYPTKLHHHNVWFPKDIPWKPTVSTLSFYNILFSVVQSTSGVSPSSTYSTWLKFIEENNENNENDE